MNAHSCDDLMSVRVVSCHFRVTAAGYRRFARNFELLRARARCELRIGAAGAQLVYQLGIELAAERLAHQPQCSLALHQLEKPCTREVLLGTPRVRGLARIQRALATKVD